MISLKLSTTNCGKWFSVSCFSAARICGLTSTIGGWLRVVSLLICVADHPAGGFHRLRRHANEQPAFRVLDAGPNPVLQRRIERDHVQLALGVAIAGANLPGQPMADIFGEQNRVLRPRGVVAQRFQDHG